MNRLFLTLIIFTFFSITAIAQTDPSKRFVVTHQVDQLLNERGLCKNTKKTKKYYHIQLYNGQNLKRAKAVKKDFQQKFQSVPVLIEWESPEFKVWVGIYENKLSADQALVKIRQEYPNAFIVNPKK